MYQDKTLKCRDCGKDFVWTSGEQEFFASKGFSKPPIRCTECRKKKKDQHNSRENNNSQKEFHEITCSQCGKKTEVDFKPRNPVNILCAECFDKTKNNS